MSAEPYAFLGSEPGRVELGDHRLIRERNEFIPAWYVPHESPELIPVTRNGEPIPPGFTVADVLPERRWAIGAKGEALEPLKFRELYIRKMEDWFRVASPEAQQGARFAPPRDWKSHLEHIPDVGRYVAMTTDKRDRRKTLPIGYDPEANAGARSDRLYDAEGEGFVEGRERLALLTEWYHRDPNRLTKSEREEVESGRTGRSVPSRTDTQQRLDLLADQLSREVISPEQHTQEVAECLGISLVSGGKRGALPEILPSKLKHQATRKTMPCGEEVYALHSKRHLAKCEKCSKGIAS